MKWKLPKRKQPVWRIFKAIVKPFLGAKEVVNLGDEPMTEKCIIVSNHANKKGPLSLELSLPIFHARWAASPMMEGYKDRWHYLRDVLYVQKNGTNKFWASIKSTIEAIFSPYVYKGLKAIPSYIGSRMRKTINYSMECLDNGIAVGIYPENSNSGYHDELIELHTGFVFLSEMYRRKTGEDVPVYPVYIGKVNKKRKVVIGKPIKIGELMDSGLDRKAVAEHFLGLINQLYFDYFKPNGKEITTT